MIRTKPAQLPGVCHQLGQILTGDPIVPALAGTGFVAPPPETTASRPLALMRSWECGY
jgi:hypothetical protein